MITKLKTRDLFLILFLLVVTRFISFSQTEKILMQKKDTIDISYKERADSLNALYLLIQNSPNISTKDSIKKLFFKLFPDDFLSLDSIYGYNKTTGPCYLYKQAVDHIVKLFFRLDNINNDDFAKKIINISIGGKWDADAINYFQHGSRQRLNNNLFLFCKLLELYSHKETLSFWHFYFDGPCPENYKDDFNDLYSRCMAINPKIAGLMKQAYEQLLLEHK